MAVADMMQPGGGAQPPTDGTQPGGGAPPPAGGAQPSWYATHPDPAVRELMQQKQYADPMVLATSYYHANKALSGAKDVLPLPGDNAPPEQWDKVWTALGRPEKADAYQFKFAEGVKPHEGFVGFARGLFYDLGLSPTRAQQAVDKWQAFAGKQIADEATATKTANETAVAAIKSQYADDVWQQHMTRGNEVIKKLGLDTASLNAIEGNIGAAPLLSLLVKLSEKLGGEDTFRGGGGGGGGPADPNTLTKQQAAGEITRLQQDAEFVKVYDDKAAPGHAEAVEKMRVLYSKL